MQTYEGFEYREHRRGKPSRLRRKRFLIPLAHNDAIRSAHGFVKLWNQRINGVHHTVVALRIIVTAEI